MKRIAVLSCALTLGLFCWTGAMDSAHAAGRLRSKARSCRLLKGCDLLSRGKLRKSSSKASSAKSSVQGPGQTVPNDDDIVPTAPIS